MTDETWRKHNKSLSSRLKVIQRQEIFTDVVFNIQGQEFKCHRLILAIGSPYFERTFYHTFSKNSDSTPVVLSDVTPEAFRCVLNFLYSDKTTFGNENQAFDTYGAAEKFQITELKSECEIFLSELDFRPCTIWNNLERAVGLEMKKLQRKYMNYIQTNAYICLKDDAFLKVSGDIIDKVLESDKLALSEIDLVNRIVAWGRTKNPKYFKKIMGPYLRHVRFKAMTTKEFCFLIKSHPDLIDSDDSLAILQHLELPHKNLLPRWCCKLPKRDYPLSEKVLT